MKQIAFINRDWGLKN